MSVVEVGPELTQDEFLALQVEGGGVEYVRGRLIKLMPVEGQQSLAWTDLTVAIGSHVKQRRLGRMLIDVLNYLDPEGSVRYFPDIAFLESSALDQFDGHKIIGPPTLAVEVTSPVSDRREEGEKKANYHTAGAPWYWVVDTKRRRTREYRWEPAGYALESETPFTEAFRPGLFPGLEIVVEPAA